MKWLFAIPVLAAAVLLLGYLFLRKQADKKAKEGEGKKKKQEKAKKKEKEKEQEQENGGEGGDNSHECNLNQLPEGATNMLKFSRVGRPRKRSTNNVMQAQTRSHKLSEADK